MEGIEGTVNRILRDVESKDYRVHLNDLRESVEGVRSGFTEHLPKTMGDSQSYSILSLPLQGAVPQIHTHYADAQNHSCISLLAQNGQLHRHHRGCADLARGRVCRV